MKLTILLLFMGLLSVSASVYSQSTKLSLDLEHVSILEVFKQIEEQSDFAFIYKNEVIDLTQKVNVKVEGSTIEVILDELFRNSAVKYEIIKNQVILTLGQVIPSRSVEKLDYKAEQPKKSLTGLVSDKTGNPIPGVTVMVKGTTVGTITNAMGEFNLTVSPDAEMLVFSFVGLKSQEVPITNKLIFNITLEEENVGLEEVVAVGYGTQKKKSVVGAISTVKVKELQVPVRSLSTSLAGKLAGIISLQSSGEPGKDDAQFWIRGIGTFTGDQNPLVLVDGIERPLDNVDPLEIESFSVLKDASATAVYGVRGANGVILVNTRRGFDGKARIDARYEQGFSFATKRLSFVDAATRSEYFNEAIDNAGASAALKYTEPEIESMRNGSDPELYPNVDWQDLLMKDVSLTEKASVNISGGGKTARYFTAISIYNQEGQYDVNPGPYDWVSDKIGRFGKNVSYQRYNFRTNVDMDITQTTKVILGLQGNVTNNTEPEKGSDYIYDWIIGSAPNAYPVIFKDGKYSGRTDLENPYNALTQKGYKKTTGNDLRINLSIDQDFSFITKGLSGIVRYAYDAQNYNDAIRSRTINYFAANYRNELDGTLDYTEYDASSYQDYLNYSSNAWGDKTQYFETSINYDRTFGKHEIGGLLLYYMKDYRTNTASSYISSLPNRSLGIAARATYAYNSKYLLETNIGYNGSENFPKDKRMGVFPSVALGWVASQEDWLADHPTISWLKIRGSIGQVGSDRINGERFIYLATIGSRDGYSNFGELYNQNGSGLGETRLASEDVSWEVATKYNLGLEVGLFNKLRIDSDIFFEKRDNIFIQPQTSLVAGLPASAYANLGKMENKGFEITAEYSKQFSEDLMLTARGNFTFARNKVIDDGQYYAYPWQDKRNTRYGMYKGYDAMHLFNQEEIDALPDYYQQFGLTKDQLAPGDIRYRDINDDGRISEADMLYIGNPTTPEIVYGFGATLYYKNFDFSFLMQGAGNVSTYISGGYYFMPFQAARDPKYMGNVMTMFKDRWNEDNQNQYAFSPRFHYGEDTNNYQTSTWWLRDSDYIRLKNVEIGYTLPDEWFEKSKLGTARFYLSGVNLLTLGKFYRNFWDPETKVDKYPAQTQIFVGLNLTF
jgi:TonB-linked SusC/RagA family outer membrane protein